MTPADADRALDSPLRLVLLAELVAREQLTLQEAVLSSGRHEHDVTAALSPLVAAGLLTRNPQGFAIRADVPAETLAAIHAGIEARGERLARERFVRGHVLGTMIGVDPKMQLVFEAIRQVCRLDVPVLITGETGSGKELVARAIHELGNRRGGPLVSVNCATLPAALFESHAFGHVRGAFTGALQDHIGVVEQANGGTLFLDEIGELEPANQAKLLRVLQQGTFRRLGEQTERHSNFRLVAATHRDLPAMIAKGTFREDLYYRCNVFAIRVPSLRERPTDLPYIAEEVLRANLPKLGMSIPPPISEAAMRRLARHRWPGNVRELENVILRATIAAGGGAVGEHHLAIADAPEELVSSASPYAASLTLAQVERLHVSTTLAACDGNLKLAAQRLGVARATLYRILDRHGIARRPEG